MSSRALLRVKRRRSEDPFEALMISCRPKRARDSAAATADANASAAAPSQPRSAGGDYEGAEWSDRAPPLPVISKVFHLAGSVAAAAATEQEKLIEEIRDKGRPTKKRLLGGGLDKSDRKKSSSRSSAGSTVSKKKKAKENNNNDDDDDDGQEKRVFQAVLQKRKLKPDEEEDDLQGGDRVDVGVDGPLRVFDVVKTERVALDEFDEEFRARRDVDVITCNDVPMMLEDIDGRVDDFVFDLYYSMAEGSEGKLDLSFLDTYLDVQPYRNCDLDTLENYGIVEPASMLERGFLGVEDEDSNEEDNWRNDYPDSDPEETFDREEPDYDQCGFIHDVDDALDDTLDLSSAGVARDHHLAEILRCSMKLRQKDGEDEEEEAEEEELNKWDVGNPKESKAYLEYKKRTMAQLKMKDKDDEDEDDDDEDDHDDASNEQFGRKKREYNFYAYDEKLDRDSESDSFDGYEDDIAY